MAPRKGLSFDEKRERLLEIFTESADFFTLKELEKIAPKRKGIVSQSVKEVLQSLADDDLVNSDKCGNQTVFWCLPSEASHKRKQKLAKLEDELESKKEELKTVQSTIAELETGREDSEERSELLKILAERKVRSDDLSNQLSRFADFDPEAVETMRSQTKKARECANRWTDNIFTCQSWAVSKFSMDRKDFSKQFEIPEELDYIEGKD